MFRYSMSLVSWRLTVVRGEMNGECDIEYPGFDDEKEKMEEKEMELELESSLMVS